MARAIEKGATYLDKLCHKFYDEPKGRGKRQIMFADYAVGRWKPIIARNGCIW